MSEFEVVVGNVGTVHRGSDEFDAYKTWREYMAISDSRHGRAGGETVALLRDGEILQEYAPKDQ